MTKAKGDMYKEINIIQGKCPHGCEYCYMNSIAKRYKKPEKPLFFNEKALIPLGKGKTIFIGNSTDMWAREVSYAEIYNVLNHCFQYPENKYMFQTKNPGRYTNFFEITEGEFYSDIPVNSILGTIVETNRIYPCMGNTRPPDHRTAAINYISSNYKTFFETFITIEPILDFDMTDFLAILKNASPDIIYIGADSGNNNLPEPEPYKIRELIKELETFTEVRIKPNLKRLLPEAGE